MYVSLTREAGKFQPEKTSAALFVPMVDGSQEVGVYHVVNHCATESAQYTHHVVDGNVNPLLWAGISHTIGTLIDRVPKRHFVLPTRFPREANISCSINFPWPFVKHPHHLKRNGYELRGSAL